MTSLRKLVPGLALATVAAVAALAANQYLPTVSALLIAIVLGVALRNLVPLPASLEPGLAFAGKRVLRAGIVLLGLQLVLGDILALGWGVILAVCAVVGIGMYATVLLGRWLGVPPALRLLVAAGFSICGAAAVAAMDGVIEDRDEEDVVTAIALVVLFGTLMIPLLPLAARLIGLDDQQTGMWAGLSVHEVAQVVAIGGSVSAAALSVAVVVKLARVLMLAPTLAGISALRRQEPREGARPPLVPLFVLGFVAMVVLRSTGLVPTAWADALKPVQTALLAAAMFALGTGVRFSMFRRLGPKPFVLATASTLVVAAVGLAGVLLVSRA